jgi:hypothetical protein
VRGNLRFFADSGPPATGPRVLPHPVLYIHSISEALKNDFETWVKTPRYFHAINSIAMASSELIVYEEVEDVEHGSASPVWPAVRQTVSYKL